MFRYLKIDERFGHLFPQSAITSKLIFEPTYYSFTKRLQVVRNGAQFEIDPSDYMQWTLLYGKDDKIVRFLSAPAVIRGSTIALDVGANVGHFCIKLAAVYPHVEVFAFEPNPELFLRLNRNINLNAKCRTRIHPHSLAIGEGSGRLELSVPIRNSGAGSLVRSYDDEPSARYVVELISIDKFMAEKQLPHVDFIKIDVEGFEAAVLNGAVEALARYKPDIYIEQGFGQNSKMGYPEDYVFEYLMDLGYKISIDNGDSVRRVVNYRELHGIKIYNLIAVADRP
jgi:FkbM family methyltransferase